MKENIIKAACSAALAAVCGYMSEMVVPLAVLLGVMLMDYITGMVKAYEKAELSSRVGIIGIVKKLLYFVAVGVAMVCDYLIHEGLQKAGMQLPTEFYIALIVVFWLIINELVSILENIAAIGVPVPAGLTKLIGKLKNSVESKLEDKEETP